MTITELIQKLGEMPDQNAVACVYNGKHFVELHNEHSCLSLHSAIQIDNTFDGRRCFRVRDIDKDEKPGDSSIVWI